MKIGKEFNDAKQRKECLKQHFIKKVQIGPLTNDIFLIIRNLNIGVLKPFTARIKKSAAKGRHCFYSLKSKKLPEIAGVGLADGNPLSVIHRKYECRMGIRINFFYMMDIDDK